MRRWNEPGERRRISEWAKAPYGGREHRAEGRLAFRERLAASLRAGHGLGVEFDLRVASGLAPVLTLGCPDPSSARWASRVLVPAFDRTAWVRRPPTDQNPPCEPWWGQRVRAWPDALRLPADGPAALDNLALALKAVPPGVIVQWRFLACPPSWGRAPDPGPEIGYRAASERTDPAGRVSRLRTREASNALRPPSEYPLFWKTTVSASFPPALGGPEPGVTDRYRAAIEAALRSGQANGVRFSPRRFRWPWGTPGFLLSEDELLCVLPGIDGEGGLSGGTLQTTLPVLPIGRSMVGRVVGPPVEPDQGRHLAVLGETGMGKSSTLVAVARKACALGGLVLFDPLGETARAFVAELSAADRSRLVQVAPTDRASGINALEGVGAEAPDPVLSDRRLNDIVHALRRVRSGRYTDSTFWGPRLEEMLTRALRAAAAFPSGTLEDAHALLTTDLRVRGVAPPGAEEAVRGLRDRVRDRPEDAEGARRLLYEVVRSPVLRAMLCERAPALHPRELVVPGRIAVISGEAATVGESVARYLLSVYLALVWSELLSRPALPKTFVVLDESQWFAHESLGEMLRLARRKNVHVVLATQTVGSLPEVVADSVWTNVSDFVAFRGSPEEARELSRATRGVSVEELLALPRGHAAVLLGKGNTVEWVRTVGRPPAPGVLLNPDTVSAERWRPPAGTVEPLLVAPTSALGRVLTWMRAQARSLPAGSPLRVDLAELRKAVDPDGRAVREAGSRLGRAGAILARTESSQGPVWLLDPARIPDGPGEASPSPSSGASELPQLS